jgi:hypothetical protein
MVAGGKNGNRDIPKGPGNHRLTKMQRANSKTRSLTSLIFIRLGSLLLMSMVMPLVIYAQENTPTGTSDTTCVQKDMPDILRAALGKPPKSNVKVGSLLLIPIIGSNPATGFMFGIGGQYALK